MPELIKQPTILIVDDMTTNILILSDLLKDEYDIKVAKNGEKAIEIVNSQNIDLILLDVEMPNLNGYEVCKILKASDKTKNIPIIFITARSSETDEEKGLDLGAIDYVTKPFSKTIVKLRIRNHIKLKEKTNLLEQLSMYDSLTNIKNRRFFDEIFEKIYQETKRDKTNLALIMIDIDHFKSYNDNYGHGKGDRALQEVAQSISNTLNRPNDLVARYGGKEFVALIKNISSEGLVTIANNILNSIGDLNIRHDFSDVATRLTASMGIAHFDANNKASKIKILMAADENLYKIKNSGKNNFLITNL